MNRLFKLCFFLLFICASCGHADKENTGVTKKDTIPVKIMDLTAQLASQEIKTSGTFTTDEEVALSFKNGGIVQQIYVKEGDAFKAGQLLASLNPTEADAGLEQARLAEAKAQRDYRRAKQLYQDSVATLEQLQNAETAFRIAKEQLRAANYNHNQTEIRAVTSGFVLKRIVNDGQVVGPGAPILQVNNTAGNNWQLKVGLSDKQWAAVQLGDSAQIFVEALTKEALPAYVYKKSEGIDPTSGTFQVMLKLKTKMPFSVGAGMFARANIIPQTDIKAWSVPYDAVLDGENGKGFVFVTNDGKTAKRIEVNIGEIQQDQLIITNGLQQAKALIISGSAYLTDGSPIRVVK